MGREIRLMTTPPSRLESLMRTAGPAGVDTLEIVVAARRKPVEEPVGFFADRALLAMGPRRFSSGESSRGNRPPESTVAARRSI